MKALAFSLAVLAIGAFAGSAWIAPVRADDFGTRLAPSPLTDGTRIDITGEGLATASLEGNSLTLSGNFHGLATPATTAALHDGLGIGILGPKAFDVTVTPATEGAFSAHVTLSRAQAAALKSGHFYLQIDSRKAPDGNLTGWLLPPHPFAGEDVPVAGHGFLPQLDVAQQK